MGANPYWYFVPYDEDAGHAFERLRTDLIARRSRDGAANPVWNSDAAGVTFGNLRLGDNLGFAVVAPLPADLVAELYGTDSPDHATVLRKLDELFEYLDRGQCAYVAIYRDGVPREFLFAGYSMD
jgi:hypothetical protein